MPKRTLYFIGAGIAALIAVIALAATRDSAGNSKLGGFTKCLKDKGAVFYGAFWCSHCQNQKKLFGNATEYLPYIECSTPDGRGQTAACIDKKIVSYPTWEFNDGTRQNGEQSLSQLAEKTGCALPP